MTVTRQLSDTEKLDWIRLARTDGIGPINFHKLLQRYGTATKAIAALPNLMFKSGANKGLKVFDATAAEQELVTTQKAGGTLVASCEAHYPKLLRQIDSAPAMLCMSGNVALLEKDSVGIVGARTASANGRKMARILAHTLSEAGFLITSGLARGIDTAAHEAATPHRTAAVIAGGIDHRYPPENAELQKSIARDGLLITELPIGTSPRAEHFPRRNRIISGMSRAVIIVEAALRSGSLITARFANEQGRDVYAVPGSPLDPRCEGTNKLIKEGASILTSADDIIAALRDETGYHHPHLFERDADPLPPPHEETDDAARKEVLSLLSANAIEIDDLIRECQCPAEAVMAVLLELEIAGRVVRSAGGMVALVKG
jgi:DNA processing protein